MTSAESKHAHLYLDLARRAQSDPATLRRWLGSIRRAWQFAQGDDSLTLQFASVLADFFRREGLGREYIERARRAIKAAERGHDLSAKALLLTNIGLTLAEMGETENALSVYQEALPILETLKDSAGEGAVRLNIGLILLERQGQTKTARESFERALELVRQAADWKGEAKVFNALAMLESRTNHAEAALELLEKSLEIYTRHENVEGEATTLNDRGTILADLGRLDQARDSYERSLALRNSLGDRRGVAANLDNLGVLHFEHHDYERALDFYQRALDIEEVIDDPVGMHTTLDNIGFLYHHRGEPDKALKYYKRALSIADAIGSRVHRATTLTSMALSEAAMGDWSCAVRSLKDALAIHEETGDLMWQSAALHNLGLILMKDMSDPRRALELFRKSLRLRRRIGAADAERITLLKMADAYEALHQFQSAARVLVQVVKLRGRLEGVDFEGDKARLAGVRLRLKASKAS